MKGPGCGRVAGVVHERTSGCRKAVVSRFLSPPILDQIDTCEIGASGPNPHAMICRWISVSRAFPNESVGSVIPMAGFLLQLFRKLRGRLNRLVVVMRPRIINREFLRRIRHSGGLALAAKRVQGSGAHYEPMPKMSTWSLVCEEVLDTEHGPAHYDRVVAEIFRRGISPDELEDMRIFAWKTAGWLNFDKTLWDWCLLDEDDIRFALDWMLRDGIITATQRSEYLNYLERYTTGVHAADGGMRKLMARHDKKQGKLDDSSI